jgi:hypothetical protein
MKRSEMIEIIKNQLFGPSNYPGHKDEAEALLNVIERYGMLPPILESESFKMLPSGELTYQVNSWEKE